MQRFLALAVSLLSIPAFAQTVAMDPTTPRDHGTRRYRPQSCRMALFSSFFHGVTGGSISHTGFAAVGPQVWCVRGSAGNGANTR
jgi:hypothetical protein